MNSAGTITYNAGTGTFTVQGSHAYAEEGAYAITVTVKHDSAANATATSKATITDPAVVAIGGFAVNGVEGAATGAQTVATFKDPGGAEALTDYSASISWGDGGAASAGTITYNAGTSVFTVQGSHTYAAEGSDTITVTIKHDATAGVTATSKATVADAAVQATGGFTVSGTEAAATGTQTVATFQDPGGAEALSDYSASIAWGDGGSSAGTITVSGGVFTVQGGHTYSEEGSYTVTVTIKHDTAPNITATSKAAIADPAVVATGGFSLSGIEPAATGAQTVATFKDPAGAEALSEYSAGINWGDGSAASAGTITYTASTGVFTVQGSHTYTEEGAYTITVTIKHGTAPDASATSRAAIADPAVQATGGLSLSAVEGTSTGTMTVATFKDPGGAEPLTDYSASIAWGDGMNSAGTITYNAGTGTFTVQGSHAYAEEGSNPVTVTIKHGTAPDSTVTDKATVSDPAVIVTGGLTLSALEGTATGAQTVATFKDPGGAEALGDYSASISWGDGGAASAGTITYNAGTGVFTVQGNHTYSEEGSDTITVTVKHDATAAVSATSQVTVADAAVQVSGGLSLSAVENTSTGTLTVATFKDPGGAEPLTDYSAGISWGDGSAASTGAITYNAGTGTFTVQGSHTYAEEGAYAVSVTIKHDTAPNATATDGAIVADPAVIATGGLSLSAVEGAGTGAVTVATFTDPAGAEAVGDYSARIDWGDGGTSAGTITLVNGVFTVQGSYSYADEGTYAITVAIQHDTAPAATATDQAVVADATLNASGVSIAATEGTAAIHPVVATFSDANPQATAADFSATIDWGDGSNPDAAAKIISDGNGGFQVVGHQHKYADEGSYNVVVTITDVGGSTATAMSTATVADAALTAAGVDVAATEGTALKGVVVATFSDADHHATAADFSAAIDWGDGTALDSKAQVVADHHGNFQVVAHRHKYADEGSYTITVTITDVGGSTATAMSTATVADAALAGAGMDVAATTGEPFQGVVAQFMDANRRAPAGDFSVTIDWGDGSDLDTTATMARVHQGQGAFTVQGGHTYDQADTYTITITITDVGGSTVTLTATATVTDAGGQPSVRDHLATALALAWPGLGNAAAGASPTPRVDGAPTLTTVPEALPRTAGAALADSGGTVLPLRGPAAVVDQVFLPDQIARVLGDPDLLPSPDEQAALGLI